MIKTMASEDPFVSSTSGKSALTLSSESSIICADESYYSPFMARLDTLRKEESLTDTIVTAGHLKIPCHKVVLTASSHYFDTMIHSSFKESSTGLIEFNETRPEIIKSIIDFIYTGKININADNVEDITQCCDQFEMVWLKNAIDNFLSNQIEPANCIGLRVFSDTYDLKQTHAASYKCMQTRLKDVLQDSEDAEFKSLNLNHCLEYISCDDLETENEDLVFEFLLRWVGANPMEREPKFGEIFQHVRLPFCSRFYLSDVVAKNKLVESHGCHKIIYEAMNFHLLPERNGMLTGTRAKPRSCKPLRQLLVLGGISSDLFSSSGIGTCWLHNCIKNDWEICSLSTTELTSYRACCLQSGIMVTGGLLSTVRTERRGRNNYSQTVQTVTNACKLWSFLGKKWIEFEGMSLGRHCHGIIAIADWVFVFGGKDGTNKAIASLEMFDVREQGWKNVPPMKNELIYPLGVNFTNRLYVFGGEHVTEISNKSTEMYDLTFNKWHSKAEMPKACVRGSAVVFQEKIFAVGGEEPVCMAYSPLEDTWTILTPPLMKHELGAAVMWEGIILLTGGKKDTASQEHNNTCAIEEYDPGKDKWRVSEKVLPQQMYSHHMLNIEHYNFKQKSAMQMSANCGFSFGQP